MVLILGNAELLLKTAHVRHNINCPKVSKAEGMQQAGTGLQQQRGRPLGQCVQRKKRSYCATTLSKLCCPSMRCSSCMGEGCPRI
jgi:hypothetical protein